MCVNRANSLNSRGQIDLRYVSLRDVYGSLWNAEAFQVQRREAGGPQALDAGTQFQPHPYSAHARFHMGSAVFNFDGDGE